MENSLFIIVIIALFMILVLMGIILYLGYNLLKAKIQNEKVDQPNNSQLQLHDEVIARLKELNLSPEDFKKDKTSQKKNKNLLAITEEYYCSHHPSELSVGTCVICEKAFCSHCLKNHKTLHFCQEHLQIFLTNKWTQVASVKTNPEETKEGVALYKLKRDLWLNENIPSYLETQYKIDIDTDFIESFVALYVREKDAELAGKRLQ